MNLQRIFIARLAVAALAVASCAVPTRAWQELKNGGADAQSWLQSPQTDPGSFGLGTTDDRASKPHNWTGFYVGATAGSAWNDATHSLSAPLMSSGGSPLWSRSFGPSLTLAPAPWAGSAQELGAFSRGVQAGYNLQLTPNFIVGIEGDLTSFGRGDSQTPAWIGLRDAGATTGSVRAKAGYVTDSWGVFISGGVVSGRPGFGGAP